MASPLWIEGLATFVSGVMNPLATDGQLLMDVELGKLCDRAHVSLWAQQYLLVMDQEPGGENYADWYRVLTEQVPKRRGYCLGYRASAWIAKKDTLASMLTWDETRYGSELKMALTVLAQGTEDVEEHPQTQARTH